MTQSGPLPCSSTLLMLLSAVSASGWCPRASPCRLFTAWGSQHLPTGPAWATISLSFGHLDPHRGSGEVSLDIHPEALCHILELQETPHS